MNIKILIDTLTEIPQVGMLNELIDDIRQKNKVLVPDLKKLFRMLASLYGSRDSAIIVKATQFVQLLSKLLIETEIEQAWAICHKNIISAIGMEDSLGRKSTRQAILTILKKTNNSHLVLQSLYKIGMQSETELILAKSMKMVCRVFEYDIHVLDNKSNIALVKSIIEGMTELSNSKSQLLKQHSKASLIKIFYIGVQHLDEVIMRMDSHFREQLETIWADEKLKIVQTEARQSNQVRFQQLPIVNKKILGVFEPALIQMLLKQLGVDHYGKGKDEEIFGHDARKEVILEFKLLFDVNFERLQQYLLPLYRLVVRMLYQETLQEEVVEMAAKILSLPSIKNRVVLSDSFEALVQLLNSDKVPLRKKVKTILSGFRMTETFKLLPIYQNHLEMMKHEVNWFLVYEVLDLVEDIFCEVEECFPPVFDNVFHCICFYLSSSVARVRNKCIGVMTALVNYHPAYGQLLVESTTKVLQDTIWDKIEQRDVKGFGKVKEKQTEDVSDYQRDFEEERNNYLAYIESKKKKR